MSKHCRNPLCAKIIESKPKKGWQRTPKMYCGDKCKQDSWALRRVADLISPLPAEKKMGILIAGATHDINGDLTEVKIAKTYQCTAWPSLTIGKQIRFEKGLFETKNPDLQKLIESSDAFGVQILVMSD